jgi:dCMP deaminase
MSDTILIPNWDEFFMRHVYLTATKSKDPSSKVGAILVNDGVIISEGYNGFPRGVIDSSERYSIREEKYKYVVHAEVNSILNAARNGISTKGSIMYTNGIPCNECAKSVIQAGIIEVVIHDGWPMGKISGEGKWDNAAKITSTMFGECGIKVRSLTMYLGLNALVNGKRVLV